MNAHNKKLLALAVLAGLGLTGCGGGDGGGFDVVTPPPDPVVVIPPPSGSALSVVVTGSLTNSLTEELVNTATLTFLENGVPSTNVLSVTGTAITSLAVTDGSYSFTLKAGADVTALSVVAEADGFIENSISLNLSDAEGEVPSVIALTPTNVAGVADTTQQATVAGGAVAAETVIEATTTSGSAATAVTVPAGTVLQDANGNPVTGAAVTMQVTTVATTAESEGAATAAAVIPAGLNADETQDLAVPVGVVNVKMTTDTGAKVAKFSSPIKLSMKIPAGNIQPGQQVFVKAFDEDTGKWSTELLPATVGQLDEATNSYTATFEVSHLTFFAATKQTPRCAAGSALTYNGANASTTYIINWISDDVNVKQTITGSSLSQPGWTMNKAYGGGIAANGTARMIVKDTSGNVWADTVSEVQMCGGNVVINMTNPVPTTFTKALTVTATCPNSTVTTQVANADVKFALPNKAWSTAAQTAAGVYSLSGLAGTTPYNVKITTRMTGAPDQTFTVTPNATAETRNITLTNCQVGTGAG